MISWFPVVRRLKTRIEDLKTRVEELRTQIAYLNRGHEERMGLIVELERRNVSLARDYGGLDTANVRLHAQVARLENENAQLRKEP